jgi:hypothetical protein
VGKRKNVKTSRDDTNLALLDGRRLQRIKSTLISNTKETQMVFEPLI